MFCQDCGLDLDAGSAECPACSPKGGVAPDAFVESPTYSTLGRRLAAYVLDWLAIYVLVVLAVVILQLFGNPIPPGYLDSRLANILLLIAYMTLLQVFTHNTIGKYIAGIQVISSSRFPRYPSVGRILLRETVGRIASLFFFGMGYWRARQPERQAWSDQMADTVVVPRATSKSIRLFLITSLAISATLCGALVVYGNYTEEQMHTLNSAGK